MPINEQNSETQSQVEGIRVSTLTRCIGIEKQEIRTRGVQQRLRIANVVGRIAELRSWWFRID